MTKTQEIKTLIEQGKTNPEIVSEMQTKGISTTYATVSSIRAAIKRGENVGIGGGRPKKYTPELKTDSTPETATDIAIETITQIPQDIDMAQIKDTAQKNLLSKESVISVFRSINNILPEKYRRDKDSVELLGEVWESPLNRIIGKYIDQNADIYLAVVVTILVFVPVPIQMIADSQKKKQEKQQPKETQK